MTKAEQKKDRRAGLLAKGFCPDHCKRSVVPEMARCQECLDRKNTWAATARGKKWQQQYQRSELYLMYRKSYKQRTNVKVAHRVYMQSYLPTYQKRRIQTDESFRLARNLRTRLWWATKGLVKRAGSAVRDLGCTIEEFRSYIEALWEPGMTWSNWGRGVGTWQLDHRRQLASFDLTQREDILTACHFLNLQPLWEEDHIRKSNTDALTRSKSTLVLVDK